MAQQAYSAAWYVNSNSTSGTGYYSVNSWTATSAYSVGNIIRQNATPVLNSERCYICTSAGTTSSTEPTWTSGAYVTMGATVTDNNVQWCECTGQAAANGDLVNTYRWSIIKAANAARTGVTIKDVSNNLFINTTSGTMGTSEPSWNTTIGQITTEISAVAKWTCFANGATSAWGAPHARLANAFASTWMQAGNTAFVAGNHAETQAATMTLTSPGTAAAICNVLCVDQTASVPPGGSNLKTTATISTSGNTNITIGGSGFANFKGITFTAGNSTGTALLTIGGTAAFSYFDGCSLVLGGSGSSSKIQLAGPQTWNNTTVQFGTVLQSISFEYGLTWKNTLAAVNAAGSIPTTLFTLVLGGSFTVQGVDLSALGSGTNLSSVAANAVSLISLTDCKLGAGVTPTVGAVAGQNGAVFEMVNCDSSNTNYRFYRQNYMATEQQEITIVRTGGASDGTTPMARKIVTTANASFVAPYQSDWMEYWNNTSGVAISPYVCITNGYGTSGQTLTSSQVWLELESLTTSGYPLGTFYNDAAANVLTAGTNQAIDNTSVWATSTSATVSQIIGQVSITPQSYGVVRARVCVAQPSLTMWYDPYLQAV